MSQDEDIIQNPNLTKAFQLIESQAFAEAEALIQDEIKKATDVGDGEALGLFQSALGVLYKNQGDFKKAYKAYQQAEKTFPEDLSLKMINARLLVEQFSQFDTALRKLKKILDLVEDDEAMKHHALALKAIAEFSAGKRGPAKATFEELLNMDFSELRSSANLDYKTLEHFLRKSFETDLCEQYLQKALDLAKKQGEDTMIQVLEKLREIFSSGSA